MKYETLGADLLETVCGVCTEFRAGISHKDLAYYINVSGIFSQLSRIIAPSHLILAYFVRLVITWRESRWNHIDLERLVNARRRTHARLILDARCVRAPIKLRVPFPRGLFTCCTPDQLSIRPVGRIVRELCERVGR